MKTILIRMKSRANGGAAPERRARRRETLLGALVLAAALALFVLLTAALCRPLAVMLSDPARLRAVVRRQGAFGVLTVFGLEVVQGFLPLPLEVTAVAAGYLFGPFGGFLLTLVSVVCSTALIFTLAKLFGERFFLLLFPHGESPWILRDETARRLATWTVFLIPGLPKRLFILSAAFVPQRFSRFLAISTLVRVPALLFCSFGGHALGSGNYARAIPLLCVVAVPALAAFFIYRSATARKK